MDLLSDWPPPQGDGSSSTTPAASTQGQAQASAVPSTTDASLLSFEPTGNTGNATVSSGINAPSGVVSGNVRPKPKKEEPLLTPNDLMRIQWKNVPGVRFPRRRISFGYCSYSPFEDDDDDTANAGTSFLVICGGMDDDHDILPDVHIYDASSNSFQSFPPMTTARSACAAVCCSWNNSIYALGGVGGAPRTALSSVEVYSASLDTWQYAPSMPTPRAGCMAFSYYNKGTDIAPVSTKSSLIVVLGGHNGSKLVEQVLVLDTSLQQWSSGPNMPFGRIAFGGVQVTSTDVCGQEQQTVYVIGGRTSNGKATDAVHAWTMTMDTSSYSTPSLRGHWKTLAPLPSPRYGCTAMATQRYILVAGGYNKAGKPLRTTEVYCMDTNTWSNIMPNLKRPKVGAGGVCCDKKQNRFCIIGGLDGKDFCSAVEELTFRKADMKIVRPTGSSKVVPKPPQAPSLLQQRQQTMQQQISQGDDLLDDTTIDLQNVLLQSASNKPASRSPRSDALIDASSTDNSMPPKRPSARGLPLGAELGESDGSGMTRNTTNSTHQN